MLRKQIIGKVKYIETSSTKVNKVIEIHVDKSYKDKIWTDHIERSAIIIVIDKSGSMQGKMDSVKKASKEILTSYWGLR
jgi:uncharacterized protein with von Willebrand factor type A (vWA) domain